MGEFWLLTQVGFVIDTAVKIGYAIAGGYAIKTGFRYMHDYKDSIEKEKIEVK